MFDNLPSVLDIDKLMLPTTIYAKDPNTGGDVELATFYDQNRSPVNFDEVNPSCTTPSSPARTPASISTVASTSSELARPPAEPSGRRRDPGWVLDQPAVRQERPHPALRARRRRHGGADPGRGARQLLDRSDDGERKRRHRAQTPGDALRDRPRAEVFQERHPSRLPQHLELRRRDLRHRRRREVLLRRGGQGPVRLAGRDARRHRAEPQHLSHRPSRADRSIDGDGVGLQQGSRRPDRRRPAPGSSPRSTRCSRRARSPRSSTSPRPTATPRPRADSSTCSAACSTTARSRRSSTSPRRSSRSRPSITPGDDRLRDGRRVGVLLPVRPRHHRERSRRSARRPRSARRRSSAAG